MRPEAVALLAVLASAAGVVAWRRAAAAPDGAGGGQPLPLPWDDADPVGVVPELDEPGTSIGGQIVENITSAPQPASEAVDWSRIRHFAPDEFKGQLDRIAARLVYALDDYREALGSPVIISPASGALARDYGSPESRHYAVGRLCDAADVMAPGRSLRDQYDAAAAVPEIGAIGVYPHWSPHPGIHVDTRPRKAGGTLAMWADLDGSGWPYDGLDWSAIA